MDVILNHHLEIFFIWLNRYKIFNGEYDLYQNWILFLQAKVFQSRCQNPDWKKCCKDSPSFQRKKLNHLDCSSTFLYSLVFSSWLPPFTKRPSDLKIYIKAIFNISICFYLNLIPFFGDTPQLSLIKNHRWKVFC